MNPNEVENPSIEWNRREFLRGTSFGTMMMLMGGVPIMAQDAKPAAPADGGSTKYSTDSPPISCGVIGCGVWGREILQTLAVLLNPPKPTNAPVVAICDSYEPLMKRAKDAAAPKAELFTDYHKLLEQRSVQAVIVATPSHQHKEIVLAALAAGKHVYCEAPLATTVEDAREIAKAAKAAIRLNFQSGLQMRSDPQKQFLLPFIRSGAVGKAVMARSQWHKKGTWRKAASSPEREKSLNWRLSKATSAGLMGEIGIHQLDLISWYLNGHPTAISGFGGILGANNNDGRDVADTVQALLEFPDGVNSYIDLTLANSFDSEYDILYGTDSAILMRDNKAWMFKESDAQVNGWEVYARRDKFYNESGIALVADASKQKAMLQQATSQEQNYSETPLHYALKAFVKNCNIVAGAVEDFKDSGGSDEELRATLTTPAMLHSRGPAAGYREGFEATMLALKANEAATKGQKLVMQKEWFEL